MDRPNAAERQRWIRKNAYYHRSVASFIRRTVPQGSRVLQIGSDLGQVLAALDRPARAVGIEIDPGYVALAERNAPGVEFRVGDFTAIAKDERFDTVILADAVGGFTDIQAVLERVHDALDSTGRLIITYYNYLWEPLLRLGDRLGWKMPQRAQNWLPLAGLDLLLELTAFETVSRGHFLLLPRRIPILSDLVNRFLARLPILRDFSLVEYAIARPVSKAVPVTLPTCSVIVPARNEAGTISELVDRLPAIGSHTQLIFVEGHSRDDTLAECERVREAHPTLDILVLRQHGKGKGDAVRTGFAAATGDVLMILDADLSVPPEELPRFYLPLATGRADMTNGTRLVYPIERQAMRYLNLLANRVFGILFSYLIGQPLTDTLCGTKAVSRTAYDQIAANRSHFGEFDPFGDFDLLLGAARLNLKILEVPVHYRARKYGETNITRFSHGLLLLRMSWIALMKLKFTA